jgi:RES domain-containing protein
MTVYRLARSKFKNDLSGEGARIAGGRWNSPGIPVLYTTESRALCTLEIAVHTPLKIVPQDYMMICIDVPSNAIKQQISVKDLPPNWKFFPEIKHTQIIGDQFFLEGKHLALKVPSAIVAGDYNILINPLHSDFKQVKVLSFEPFEFDQRLFIKEPLA